MKEKINWPRFWFSFLLGLLGLSADLLALIGFASGQLEIPNVRLLNNPYVISTLSFAMMMFTVLAISFALLELSKNKLKKYKRESRPKLLFKGAYSISSMIGVPAYIIWLISSLALIWSSSETNLSVYGMDVFGALLANSLITVFSFFVSLELVPKIGFYIGNLIIDLQYLFGSEI